MAKRSYSGWSTYWLLKNLPFIVFVGFLGTVYIANAHYAERKVREIQTLQKELKETRWRYMSLKSELMYNSKQVEVADRARNLGLRALNDQPKKIIIKE